MTEVLRALGSLSILFGMFFAVILFIVTPPLLDGGDGVKDLAKLFFLTFFLLLGGWLLGGTLKF